MAVRGTGGAARVLSAYCAHLGADLSAGDVVGESLRCAFHHWLYNAEGKCTSTKVGDEVVRETRAALDELHVAERGSASANAR